eukprot:CCRYP_020061-RA/>CCRYP_020061-RA protein AED:0.41 eAED:0.41 QI:0/0.5/0.33/1/0/0/3/140/68
MFGGYALSRTMHTKVLVMRVCEVSILRTALISASIPPKYANPMADIGDNPCSTFKRVSSEIPSRDDLV